MTGNILSAGIGPSISSSLATSGSSPDGTTAPSSKPISPAPWIGDPRFRPRQEIRDSAGPRFGVGANPSRSSGLGQVGLSQTRENVKQPPDAPNLPAGVPQGQSVPPTLNPSQFPSGGDIAPHKLLAAEGGALQRLSGPGGWQHIASYAIGDHLRDL